MKSGSAAVHALSQPGFLAPAMAPMVERFAARIRMDAELDRLVLPSVPDSVIAVRNVLHDPDASIEEACRAIGHDPTLAARLLRVANSPAFAGISTCNALPAAVVRLGNAVVENVMLILAVARVFSVGKRAAIQPHLTRLWAHSARVAALSDVLAEQTPHLQRDVAVLAGLIHDIGAIPLLVKAQEYPTLFNNPLLLNHLIAVLHGELGEAVLESWNGPPELAKVVTGHDQIERDVPGPADYTDLVLVANLVSYVDMNESEAAEPYWSLPACRKLGVDADTLPELVGRAQESEATLCASVQG